MTVLWQKPFRGTQLNRTHPLAKGLFGYWLFNEGSGQTAFDLSGNNRHSTLENMNPSDDWVGGPHGWVLDFDGNDDQINVPISSFSGPMTFVALVYSRDVSWEHTGIIYFWDSAEIYKFASLNLDEAEISSWAFNRWNGIVLSDNVAEANKWTHLVGVCDADMNLSLYVDAIKQTGSDTGIDATYDSLLLGRGYIGGVWETLNGQIDHILIYGRALSAEEIAWLHREPYAMFEQPTRAKYFYIAAAPARLAMFLK